MIRTRKSESHGEIEQRLESLICRIGEKSTSSLESNLEGLGKVLKSDLNNFKEYVPKFSKFDLQEFHT